MNFKDEISKTEQKIKILESNGKLNISKIKKLDTMLRQMSQELIKQKIKLEVLTECEQKER